jgi:hypothetical protein
MTGEFEIISDTVKVEHQGETRKESRVLGLLDCERPGLDKSLDFVLSPEDAQRFKEIFAAHCIGRLVKVSIRRFLRLSFGGRIYCQGTIVRVC